MRVIRQKDITCLFLFIFLILTGKQKIRFQMHFINFPCSAFLFEMVDGERLI